MPQVQLKCLCGKVTGETADINEHSGTRIHCCCDDCQAFAQYLNHEKSIVDHFGGTDIFQMPLSHLKINQGHEQIACVKLSAKGMHRWYTTCCNTPIGNTMGPKMPFIGVIHNFMANAEHRDVALGKSRGYVHIKFANEKVPENLQAKPFNITLRIILKLLLWKIKGLNNPNAFFNQDQQPIVKPKILK